VYPIIAKLGPFTIYSYGLMLAIGFIVGGHVLARELERRGLDPDISNVVVFWGIVGGLLGARLYFIVLNWNELKGQLASAIFSASGLVWYGGLAGGVLACWIAFRRRGVPAIKVMDAAAPGLALAYAIGRVGCLLAGDGDYGPPTDVAWAMSFENGTVPTPPGVMVHPTPLYETLIGLAIFFVLSRLRHKPRADGWLFCAFLALQGLERAVVEVWRVNPPVLWHFSDAQLIGMVTSLIGVIGVIKLGWLKPSEPATS
jgi:phosphatidylglycerol:prolipoprotein diacylglycerol transferase